jgi:hypothetical protein
MLTNDQVSGLRVAFERTADPVTEYIIQDVARRVAEAGQLTSTAAYQIWRAQNLGMSRTEIEKAVAATLKKSNADVKRLFKQAAEVGYRFDLDQLPTAEAIPFEDNASIQQIVEAAVALADENFQNITRTLGFQTPDGTVHPLLDAYQKTTDFAFQQVITGATDYNTAIRRACSKLAAHGVRSIDYASGVHTSLEAAIRRNMMGGLGLMVEQISQKNHDDLGADGWELSAHANSAPDHEPFQGKQYTDEQYQALNNMLIRRIGTLNCGHNAFPIILGVNEPQYTPEQLAAFRADNEKGVTVDGRHYTGYEATQMQRKLERAIRTQKRRVLVDEATGDKEKLLTDQIKLQRYKQEYARFSKAAGLRTESERLHVAGFGRKQADIATRNVREVKLAKASDTFHVVPPAKGDAIKAQSIYKELQKSEVGKHAYEFIKQNKISVEINYTDELEPGTRGYTLGGSIFIYARNTKTIRLTTETIIHETTHIELATKKRTQWEEAYCFAQEAKHKKKQLTFTDLKNIIKTVKRLYPEYPWR